MLSAESYSEYVCDVKHLGTNFSKFLHIFRKRTCHKSFMDLMRTCSKVSVALNSSGLEVFRLIASVSMSLNSTDLGS